MTTEQFDLLMTEVCAIRVALENRTGSPAKASSFATSTNALPPPDQVIEGAASVTVHFGKNKGVAIGSLTEKQLLWYGAERAPSLKNDGTPFPPRAEDTLLKNACRTLWHARISANTGADTDGVPF